VFINAFRPQERGHAESFRFLTVIHEAEDAVIVPTLLVTEIASAVARANDDSEQAIRYAKAVAALPNVTLVALSPAMARKAGETAANYRLRGADALYLEIARRYATVLVSRDDEQLKRGARVVRCQTPEEVLRQR
jgi:predicted nucleic acid-binding protein